MPGPWEDYAPPAKPAGPWDDYAAPEKPFLEKLGSFARKVYENPPPTIAGARDIIKGAPAAAQELTWGADPQAAESAAGTMAGAAGMGLGFRGPGGTGVMARPITAEGRAMPLIPPRPVPPPTASEQAVEAAARGGYTLPGYVATEGTVIPQVASSIKNVPWAGQPITRTHDELLANMGQSKSGIVPLAGTPETAGERAKSGLTSFIKTESQKPVDTAYKAVDAMIDPEVRAPLDNTSQVVADIMGERAQARIPGQSEAVKRVMTAIQDPTGMDYAGTKMLRTWLGETTPQELIAQGIKPVEAKRLYGAMTKDLGNVVREAGGEDAFAAWHKANRLASLTIAQRNALSKVIGTAGDAAPEMVFERLATFANSKRGADINRLKLARQAMGPSAWGEVGAATIDRLGMAPDGNFSPQRFVTAFGNMAPAARNELFTGQQHAALADLFTVSKHIQDRITRFGNPSGTARGGIIGQAITGGALWTEPISTLTTLVGARLASEALSRPALVRAATQVSRASLSGNPVATRRALAALQAVAVREGLLSASAPPQQNLPGMAEGGRPTGPTIVGENGPEVFVPDRPGTIVPGPNGPMPSNEEIQRYLAATTQNYPKFGAGGIPINPAGVDAMLEHSPESTNVEDRRDERGGFAAAAQRTARAVRPPGGRQEGAGTQFVEGGYGIPAAYRSMDEGARKAFESAGSLQRGGSYDPAPVVQQAIGAAGAPLVAPAMEGAVLGAGAIRRAAIPQVAKPALRSPDTPLFDYSQLRNVPDVPQTNLQRYEAPRGIPERTQALASPENVARVNEVVKRGAQQGGVEWYNTEPLRQEFIAQRGPEGEAAYRQYLDMVAATSPRSKVGENARNAAYYYGLAQRGEPLPARTGNVLDEALPSPYGHIAQRLHVQNANNVLNEGGWPVLQNPKPASFVENLAGNQMPVTVDTHNARLWGMTDTKGRPIDKPAKTEYGFMEKLQQDEARKLGMTPAQYQASAWIGGGEQTGLKSSADPFLKVLEDRIRFTAQKTGETPQDVLKRFIAGQNAPGRAGPLLSLAGMAGVPAAIEASRRD